MKIALTGHTSGIGKAICKRFPNTVGFSRSNDHDISDDYNREEILFAIQEYEPDIFINNAHDGFSQVNLLYKLVDIHDGKIINISSNSSDGIKKKKHIYAVEKGALDKASEQLFYLGHDITNLRLGLVDTPRVDKPKWNEKKKMSPDYIVDIIEWIIKQPHRIREVSVQP